MRNGGTWLSHRQGNKMHYDIRGNTSARSLCEILDHISGRCVACHDSLDLMVEGYQHGPCDGSGCTA